MALVRLERVGRTAVVTIDSPPVNALGAALRHDLYTSLERAIADPSFDSMVVAATGNAFIAGADIREFGKSPVEPILPELVAAIEMSPKPIVAAIQGAALGGGLELALACHGRVAAPEAKLGLPELKLGLIPGAGGTQRLPRLIGAAKAFTMMLSGDPVAAREAAQDGLVDEVVTTPVAEAAVAYARRLAAKGLVAGQRQDRLTFVDRTEFERLAADAILKSGDMPNVMALIEAVRGVFALGVSEGLAQERRLFLDLLQDGRSKALRHFFFAEREASKVSRISEGVTLRSIRTAAVVGAGTMGGGIAMCFANVGIPVTLIEPEQIQIDRGMDRIRALYEASVARGSLTPQLRDERLTLIRPALGLRAAAEADIVIEAAFEDMEVKKRIFCDLDGIARPGAILASNTSYLDVATMAAVTDRPQDVVGLHFFSPANMHFFSPANIMKLLEIVRPEAVAEDTLATAAALARRLGKVPVVVGNCFGFVGNRMLAQRTRAADRLLVAGAFPHEIDAAVTDFGFKMGPFAMSDLAGNDIGWRTRKSLGNRDAIVADALCEAGRFGQKAGKGYYLYPEGARRGERDPEVESLIAEISERRSVERRSFAPEEIIARLMAPMINEGARILEEGIAARPGDIDVVWVYGYNWPLWRGGPMYWADRVGLQSIVAWLEQQAAEYGDEALEPTSLLRNLASEGKGFSALGEKGS